MKNKKIEKKALSVLLSLSVAGGVFLPVCAKANEKLSYSEWWDKLKGIESVFSECIEEQNLNVQEVKICMDAIEARVNNPFWGSIHEYSVTVIYDSVEDPQVETAIRECMEENQITEEDVCFYDLSDKIKDLDIIYTMISEYVEEENIDAYVEENHEECVLVCFSGYCDTEEVISKFIAENKIDATQIGYLVPCSEEPDPELKMGDSDGSGEIDILDVVFMNRVSVGVEQIDQNQKKAADVDGDGKVTLSDSMAVLQYIVGLITEL